MSNKRVPTNLFIVNVNDSNVKSLKEIKTGQIFDNNNSFHTEGLFSSEIFGPVGDDLRSKTFGRINLHLTVLHPLIYKTIIKLKSFYEKVLNGTASAKLVKGELIPSDDKDSDTGFAFFLECIPKLKFEQTNSDKRNFDIRLFEKAVKEDTYTMKYLLVMPAGLRDYTVDSSGKPQEDEVNTFYRRILAQAQIIDPDRAKKTPDVYNGAAVGMQRALGELFDYIRSLLEGKNKLIMDKWVGRKIFNSTRNVISSYIDRSTGIDDPRRMGFNDIVVGLHQFTRASAPKSLYEIKNKYIKDIFPDNSQSVFLTNVKTLKREEVVNTHIQKEYDRWTSPEGLEKVIASLGNLDIRNSPILLNKGNNYIGLLYRDKDNFKFFQDIDDLPEGLSKNNVSPVTLFEFIYMSVYKMDGKYPGLGTRYPITGYGSVYPAKVRVFTTVDSFTLRELDSNWEPIEGKDGLAVSFPDKDSEQINTMIVHQSHLATLGGDYDGDTMSLTMMMSDEVIKEVDDYLSKKEYYVNDAGEFIFSNNIDTLDAVMKYIT